MPDASPVAALDLIAADSLLSEDERAIRQTVRTYLDREVRPHVADWFEAGELPARELAQGLGELGVLGMHLHGYGCAGTSAVAYGLACLELEAVDSGVRSLVSVQGSLAMYAIHAYGSEEQKRGVAAPDGRRRGDRLLRADRAGLRLRPRRHADPTAKARRRTTGCSTAPRCGSPTAAIADVAIVWARTDDGIRGLRRADGHPRLPGQPGEAQAVAARVGHQRARARRRTAAGRRRCCPSAQGLRGPLSLPDRGPVRHRVRCARRGPRLPGDRRSTTR